MSSVAKTSIQIDTSQATAALKTLNVNLTATLGGFDGLERELRENTAALKQNTAGLNALDAGLDKTQKKAKKTSSAFSSMLNPLKKLLGFYSAGQVIGTAIEQADNYAASMARFETATGSAQGAVDMYNKVYQAAQRTRAPLQEMASAAGKIAMNTNGAFNADEAVVFAEIMQKAGKVTGQSAAEQSAAMYQMTQALASGRLAGDEFKSIRENAPRIRKAIEDEYNKVFAGNGISFEDAVAKNMITTDLIKQAVFKSADQIDKEFAKVPMRIGEYFQQIKNKVIAALTPIWKEISGMINRPDIKNAINTVTNLAIKGLYWVWGAIKKLGSAIMWLIDTYDYWKWAMYAILGVMAVIKTATMIQAVWNGILAVKTAIMTFIEGVRTKGLWAQFAAMLAVNTTMLIAVAIIIAIIALLVAVIYWLDYIVGAVYWCGAAFTNAWLWVKDVFNTCWIAMQLAGVKALSAVWSFALKVADGIANAFIDAINSVVGMFNSLVSAVGNTKIGEKLGISGLKLGTIERSNLAGNSTFLKGAALAEKNLSAQLKAARTSKPEYKSLGAAFDKGKAKGAEWQSAMKGGFNSLKDKLGFGAMNGDMLKGGALGNIGDTSSFGSGNDAIQKALKDIADNTGQTAANTSDKEDDYSLLRDVMAQRAVNRVAASGGRVKIEMVNNNSLNSKLDVNAFLAQLANTVQEAASTGAQGVHT